MLRRRSLVVQRKARTRRQTQADHDRRDAEARSRESGGGARNREGRRWRLPKPNATAVSSGPRGTALSAICRSRLAEAALSFMGVLDLLTMVSLDPMLAVVEVSERKLAGYQGGRSGRGAARHRGDRQAVRSALSRRPRASRRAPIVSRSRCRTPTAPSPMASRRRLPCRSRRSRRRAAALGADHRLDGRYWGARRVAAEGVVAFVPIGHRRRRADRDVGQRHCRRHPA